MFFTVFNFEETKLNALIWLNGVHIFGFATYALFINADIYCEHTLGKLFSSYHSIEMESLFDSILSDFAEILKFNRNKKNELK